MKPLFLRTVVVLALAGFLPARAVLMAPLSIEELTHQADLVVLGTVLSKSCQRDDAGRIYTRVELEVAETWKGSKPGPRLAIVHGGGTLGERQTTVSGQVDYQIGEEVVAFLTRNPRGQAVTLGLAQGKFHVWKDKASGQKLAGNPFHGGAEPATAPPSREFIATSGREKPEKPDKPDKPAPLSLSTLKQQVEASRP